MGEDDSRSQYSVACVAGHVDHGKTALVKALSGKDCDTHPEEKRRGITINNGFTYVDIDETHRVGLVDVPGHHRFVKTMVAGAHGIDFFILVVAADDGVMPQTVEHINILKIFGVDRGIVVITKKDLVDDEILELVTLDIQEHIAKKFKNTLPVISVNSINGDGIEVLQNLMRDLSCIGPQPTSLFRLYVDRVFSVKGHGVVVTGTSLGGSVKVGDELVLHPSLSKCIVRSIEHHDTKVNLLKGKKRIAINVTGVKKEQIHTGNVLSLKPIPMSKMVDAKLEVLDGLSIFKDKRVIGGIFFTGAYESNCRVKTLELDDSFNKNSFYVQVELDEFAPVFAGDHFVLRSSSSDRTIGGGIILDSSPLKHVKKSEQLLEHLKLRENGEVVKVLEAEMLKHQTPLTSCELAERLQVPVEDIEDLKESTDGLVSFDGKVFTSKILFEKYYSNIFALIEEFHKENYCLNKGVLIDSIKSILCEDGIDGAKQLVDKIIEQSLAEEKIVLLESGGVIRKGFSPTLKKAQQNFLNQVILPQEKELQFTDITTFEKNASNDFGLDKRDFKLILSYLEEQMMVVRLDGKLFFKKSIDNAKSQLISYLKQHGSISVSSFRDLINSNRKHSIMLLEYFDHTGTTVRDGDLRKLNI